MGGGSNTSENTTTVADDGVQVALVTAASSSPVAASTGVQCLKLSTHSPAACNDNPDFLDGSLQTCEQNAVRDGSDFTATWKDRGYSEEQANDLIANCPVSVDVPCSSERMYVVLEAFSGELPVPVEGSTTFSGQGAFLDSDPTQGAPVTEFFCFETPSCFSLRMTTPRENTFLWRTSFELATTSLDGSVVEPSFLLSVSGSGERFDICLSDCAEGTTVNLLTGDCDPCEDGVIHRGVCLPCSRGFYLGVGDVDGGPKACLQCPSLTPSSLEGSTSIEGCFSLDANAYISSRIGRIVAFDPDADSFSFMVEDAVWG